MPVIFSLDPKSVDKVSDSRSGSEVYIWKFNQRSHVLFRSDEFQWDQGKLLFQRSQQTHSVILNGRGGFSSQGTVLGMSWTRDLSGNPDR